MLRRRPGLDPPPGFPGSCPAPRYSGAGIGPGLTRARTAARTAHLGPGEAPPVADQARPARRPPFRLAFFSRLSY
jgi:hypothetical protein